MKPTPFGKYYLLERIDAGGMAEVFRAKAFGVEGFERLVAVKRILPSIAEDHEFIRMFIDEAKLAVQLNHAGIAQIFDLGVVDGSYYIALEHVHGRDLRTLLERCRQQGESMPVAQACFIVMKICEGLDYAHNKRDYAGRDLQLVHRDVSPQHVLVSFDGEVKLIDFGVAKAAGKGAKTQADILKGKSGYLSPEQVLGIVVDRRSDVFACGIVLYELLTGERLFAGETDFSTREKVRNVEILPPTTFKRAIPDELERIVLKALSKDPEERYQTAIDLHDELQAFARTSGQSYSRKDLAAWMKETFASELQAETAKLESYRELVAEMIPTPVVASALVGAKLPTSEERNATQPIPLEISQLPEPMAAETTDPHQQAPEPPGQGGNGTAVGGVSGTSSAMADARGSELAWEEDELDTQIFDDDDGDTKAGGRRGKSPRTSTLRIQVAGTAPEDLSATLQGWEGGPIVAMSPSIASALTNSGQATFTSLPPSSVPPVATEPPRVPALGPGPLIYATPVPAATAVSAPLVPTGGQPRLLTYVAVGGAAFAVAAVFAAVVFRTGSNADDGTAGQPNQAVADPDTGFDLYVTPAGVTTWRLDGDVRTDHLPSRIRGIAPGVHQLAIDAPPGFLSQRQSITLVQGTSPKIEIVLDPIAGIKGTFQSTPPGAKVSLIIDGSREPLGKSPASAPLDPRKTYQVLFEMPGYVSVNRPITFSGSLHEQIAVELERVGGAGGGSAVPAASAARPEPVPSTATQVAVAPKVEVAKPAAAPKVEVAKPAVAPKVEVAKPAAAPKVEVAKPAVAPKVEVAKPAVAPKVEVAKPAVAPKVEVAKPAVAPKVEVAKPAVAPKVEVAKPAVAPKVEVAKPAAAPKPAVTAKPSLKPSAAAKPTALAKPDASSVEIGAKRLGTLFLGSKPPCEIFIDGASTGKYTPQKDLKLTAGKHRITLINTDLGVRETFVVDIKPDQVQKAIKDFSDRIQSK